MGHAVQSVIARTGVCVRQFSSGLVFLVAVQDVGFDKLVQSRFRKDLMLTKGLMFCLMLIAAMSAYALPPAVEADRLALKARSALDAKDYPLAIASLTEMEKLGVPLPQSFHYLKGVAQNGSGKYYAAKESLEKYLKIAGSSGKFYKEALEAYNRAETAVQESENRYKRALAEYEESVRNRPDRIKKCEQEKERRQDEAWQEWRKADKKQSECWAKLNAGRVSNCRREDRDMEDADYQWKNFPFGNTYDKCNSEISQPTPPKNPIAE